MRLKSALLASVMTVGAVSGVVLCARAGVAAVPGQAPAAPAAAPAPAAAAPGAAASAPQGEVATYKAMVTRYCGGCHGGAKPIAGLSLATLDLTKIDENAPTLEKVVRKLRGRMMPPPGMPRPDDALTGQFVDYLEHHLDEAAAKKPDPGRIALHRLNRKEYANAVRDILGLKVDPTELLPQDDTSDSFDNVADVLQVSPVFLDQYITAARVVAIQAVGDLKMRSEDVDLKPPPGANQAAHVAGLPLGTRGGFSAEHTFPAEGDYEFTYSASQAGAYENPIRQDRFVAYVDGKMAYDSAKTPPPRNTVITGVDASDLLYKFKLHLPAGVHKVDGAFIASTYLAELPELSELTPSTGIRGSVIKNLKIVGPANPVGLGHSPSRDAIFVCHPAAKASAAVERACAQKILARVARKAFRRPLTEADMVAPMKFYDEGAKHGGFEPGVQQGLMAVLASPKFLYRTTTPPKGLAPGVVYAVNDIDLASRLSFFLWSSVPDDQLIQLAAAKRLHEPKVLDAQVKRMLADPKAETLTTNFAFQWLTLGSLQTTAPDPTIFPEFDPELRAAFQEEIKLFLDSVIRDDHPVTDLLTAKYTFVNERLAKHYGIPNIMGSRFRRVELTDPTRYGLLGKGAILTVTSYPNRTAPVIRGAWILENILGTPPSPPPPSAGGLAENVAGEKQQTVRALLETHRRSPTCNACHGVLDPIGLSLENFDAIGSWRKKDRMAGDVIDASATTVAGEKMNGPIDLRNQIAKRPEQFVRTFTQKLMTYGLGRSVEYHDMPAVRSIVRKAQGDNYRFSSLVLGIVHSDQFLKSKVPQMTPEPTKIASSGR